MRTRITIVAASIAGCLMGVTAPSHGEASAAPEGDAVSLFHRFTVPAKVAWGPISVELAPGNWRVGHLDGPVATEAQLRAVLARLTALEVGGRCAGWVEGPTSYPCGFAIADLDFGGTVEQRFSAITADQQVTIDSAQTKPMAGRTPGPDLAAHGLISPVLDVKRFVALRAPLRYLGDKSRALGARMQFRFRAVTNSLVPSEFDRASGAVVLHADPRVPLATERDEQRHPAPGAPT